MVLWIYLPARSILAEPYGDELTYFSPRWSDIFSANVGGGGVWGLLYDDACRPTSPTSSSARGFTPILLVTFVVIAMVLFRRAALGRPAPLDGDAGPARSRVPRCWRCVARASCWWPR